MGTPVASESVLGHVGAWFRDHFGKTLEEVRDDLETAKTRPGPAENWAEARQQAATVAALVDGAEGIARTRSTSWTTSRASSKRREALGTLAARALLLLRQ
jgi:hypothetical protein